MIGPAEKKTTIRIAGYLEKRGKMRLLVCRWKRWWFVLEGRLLLYYKSQLEYINLSPCRGSLNMGLASSVRPGKGLELTVITRSQSVTLRASNRVDHEQWLQSLIDAMALSYSVSTFTSRPVKHFRYSSQEYHENIIERIRRFKIPYDAMTNENCTTPTRAGSCEISSSSSHSSGLDPSQSQKCMLRRVFSDSRTLLRRPCKRSSTSNSVRLSKIAFSDTSIPVSTQARCISPAHSSEKCQSMQELRNSVCASDENLKEQKCKNNSLKNLTEPESAIIKDISKESKLSNSITIELNLEDVSSETGESVKEQKIGNVKIVLDGCTIYGSRELNSDVGPNRVDDKVNGSIKQMNNDYIDKRRLHLQLHNSKEAKSDTDLAVKRKTRGQSLSCENVQTLDRSIGSTYQDPCPRIEIMGRDQRVSFLTSPESSLSTQPQKPKKKRSNSILSRILDSKNDMESGGTLERQGTIKKRLSFLRKVWKRREKKPEEDGYESNDYESIPVVVELPSPEVEKPEDLLLSLERQGDLGPEPEPPPDYDISLPEEEEVPPMLPPRLRQRPVSPWHDVPKNNKPVLPTGVPEEDSTPPPLPKKTKQKKTHQVLIKITDDTSSIEQNLISLEGDSIQCEPPSRNGEQKLEDLDTLLAQLAVVNTYVVRQIDVSEGFNGNIVQVSSACPEPDYDIPRPHISLLATLRTQQHRSDTFPPTHFLCTTPLVDTDSLDPVISRLDAEMTPDSLECDSPWSLNFPSEPPWFQPNRLSDSSHSGSLLRHFINTEDKLFPDSLNS